MKIYFLVVNLQSNVKKMIVLSPLPCIYMYIYMYIHSFIILQLMTMTSLMKQYTTSKPMSFSSSMK